ncbi:MAG: tetratricopeptide repeat protein [Cyclobacteriaceae bacterium]
MNRLSISLLGFILLLISFTSEARQSDMLAYPMVVNLDDFSSCEEPADSSELVEQIKNADLTEERSYKEGEYSRIKMVDLNGDGKCEILHYFSNNTEGGPYDFFTIYRLKGNGLVKIGDFPGFLVSFGEAADKSNWLPINAGYTAGTEDDPVYYNSVYTYNGTEYTMAFDPKQTYSQFREKGLEAYEQENYELAKVCFQNAYVSPHHAREDILYDANNLSMVLINLDRAEEAYSLLQPMVEDNTVAYPKTELADAWYNLGLMAENKGNNEEALACYERACRYQESAACSEKVKVLAGD